MATSPTHVVVGSGHATRSGADAGAPAGPSLTAGQRVAVLGHADDGWAEVELADGSHVWVEAGALEPVEEDVVAVAIAEATALLAVPVGLHPPPPAPGAELPVKVAGIRLTTQLFAGALIVAAALLPWTSQEYFASTSSAFGVPLRSLIDPDPEGVATSGFVKLAFLVVPLGVLVLVAGFRLLPPVVGQAAGGAAGLIALLFMLQLQRVMGKFYAATVFGVLGIGVYITILAGVLAALSRGAPGERA